MHTAATVRFKTVVLAGTCMALACSAAVAATPQTSLNNCQNAVKVETATFIKNKVTAIGTCLQKISTEIVKNNHNSAAAAATCVMQLRKVNDSRGQGKSLTEKLTAGVTKKCKPGEAMVTHTLADITGKAVGVPEQIETTNIDAWCGHFGGDGSIDSVEEWVDCLVASAECAVDAAISVQYPRALEWFDAVKPWMLLVTPPDADPSKVTDAVAGLDTVNAAIEGTPNDNVPNMQCGSISAVCGNGAKEVWESCDGADLGGQTCQGLGFTGGTVGCTTGCRLDVSACTGLRARLPATGQTTSYTAGDDGAVKAGSALIYADNGNGTITDLNTGLMWEKKVDNGGLHDVHNIYVWTPGSGSIWEWVGFLNAEGGTGYAGHNDWRIPNKKELESIVDAGRYSPAVDPAFNTGCTAGCTELTCSCTASTGYWSSTTLASNSATAWLVSFYNGSASANDSKPFSYRVRAVRGGL